MKHRRLAASLALALNLLSGISAHAAVYGYRVPVHDVKPDLPAPLLSADKTSLSFGTVVAGTTSRQTVTLSNTGSRAAILDTPSVLPSRGPFSIESSTCGNSLPPNGTCAITVAVAPTAVNQLIEGYYSLVANNVTVALSGNTFVPAPDFSVTQDGAVVGTLGFGAQAVGTTSAPQTIVFENSGNVPLTITRIATVGSFSSSHSCGTLPATLAPGARCNINATFTPVAAGPVTADSALSVDTSIGAKTVMLTGTGLLAEFKPSESSVAFGSQETGGHSSAHSITLANTGNLTITGLTVTPPTGFQVSNNSCGATLAVSGSCAFDLTFAPTATQDYTGSVSITSNAVTQRIAVTGKGTTPLALTLPATTLPAATRSTPYSFDMKTLLQMSGDTQPAVSSVTWSTPSTLPSWLSLATDGTLSGTPSVAGSATFDVVATYTNKKGQQTFTIVVNGQALDVVQVVEGFLSTCALTVGGDVKCWGHNGYGQLGDGTWTDRYTPITVQNLGTGVVRIGSGTYHMCAVYNSGSMKCWGANYAGQMGDGTSGGNAHLLPTAVPGITNAIDVVGGEGYTCALLSGGGLKCWGANAYGQLGDGTTIQRNSPVTPIGMSSGVKSVSSINGTTCVATNAGAAYCWGRDSMGAVGSGDTTSSAKLTPLQVYGLSSGVQTVTTLNASACALLSDGTVKCWGTGTSGELGTGVYGSSWVPVSVKGLSGVTAIKGGASHVCAIAGGGVKCWGQNSYGQLGDGTFSNRISPISVPGLTSGIATVSAGNYHTCVTTTTGGLKCWGNNQKGQMGNGTTTNVTSPMSVSIP